MDKERIIVVMSTCGRVDSVEYFNEPETKEGIEEKKIALERINEWCSNFFVGDMLTVEEVEN